MAEAAQQNQTLSLRISEALRKRLEEIRKLTAIRKGENVSTSEIAKQLLESAREERLEVVELLAEPTESLAKIRRKGQAGQMLSRAEWTVVAYFAQQGAEGFHKNPLSRETFIEMLKAFEAVHTLRKKSSGQDHYYLGNLPSECRPDRMDSGEVTPEMVRETVAETVRRMSDPRAKWRPTFAARNLYVLLDGEKLPGAAVLHETLVPYWRVLWRAAARGHYFQRREPVRESEQGQAVWKPGIPPVSEGEFMLSFARGEGSEFSMLMTFPGDRGALYPMSPYPMISEFRALLAGLPKVEPPMPWDGERFFGYLVQRGGDVEYWFRAQDNGITFGFTREEWKMLSDLFRKAWERPEVQVAWDEMSLEYGEL